MALPDKLNRPLTGPSGLVQLRRHTILAGPQRVEVAALCAHPIGIIVALRPVIARRMTEPPVTKTIINPRLRSLARTLQMKFPNESALITGIGDQPRNYRRPIGKRVIAVARVVHPARV